MKRSIAIIAVSRLSLFSLLLCLLAGAAQAGAGQPVPDDPNKVKPLGVGQHAPQVTVTNVEGQPVDLLKTIKAKPTVLIFYRGGWCPYCNSQLGEIGAIETKLVGLGYQIIALSPDSPTSLKKTVEKDYGRYLLLSDSDMNAARAFGLAFRVDDAMVKRYKEDYKIDLEVSSGRKHHMLPVPAAFMINTQGEIEYRYYNPNYKVRIDSDELLKSAAKAVD